MNYPYEKEFNLYCKTAKNYTDNTMLIVTKSIATFWNYYVANSSTPSDLKHLQAADIQNFLNSLEEKLHFKKNTINKYISHIKLYFTFLYSHQLIDHYPVIEINGRKFNRKHVYVIHWMDQIPQIAQNNQIHPETIMMMVGISLGYLPKEVLQLRYSDVINKINNYELRKYIKNNLDFSQNDDPYLLATKKGSFYASDFHIAQRIKSDRKLIGMDITLQNLRLSYVYSILYDGKLTDEELQKKLKINLKSLFYYRENMLRYNEINEFKLNK